jgi:hypothetical protein
MRNKKENNKSKRVLLEALCTPLKSISFQSIPAEEVMVIIKHKFNIETNLRKLEGMEKGVLAHTPFAMCRTDEIEVTQQGGFPPPKRQRQTRLHVCKPIAISYNPADSNLLEQGTDLLQMS